MSIGLFVFLSACGDIRRETGESVASEEIALSTFSQADREGALPVGFDRSGMMVTWDKAGRPRSSLVTTSLPVLHFSGYNESGDKIAYTSLERLISDPIPKRVKISWRESQDFALDDLVPTGQLIVQDGRSVVRVSEDDEFVVFATWSPIDPKVLAYGYTLADTSGIVVLNVETRIRIVSIQGDLNPDAFFWNDDAHSLSVYQAVDSVEGAGDESTGSHHGKTVSYRVKTVHLEDGSVEE